MSFEDYELDYEVFSKDIIESNYFLFEEINLTSGSNTWLYSANDNVFSIIDAIGGEDDLLIQENSTWTLQDINRYKNFETLRP